MEPETGRRGRRRGDYLHCQWFAKGGCGGGHQFDPLADKSSHREDRDPGVGRTTPKMSFSNINRGATCAARTDLSEKPFLVSNSLRLRRLIGYDNYHGVRKRQEQTVKDLQES